MSKTQDDDNEIVLRKPKTPVPQPTPQPAPESIPQSNKSSIMRFLSSAIGGSMKGVGRVKGFVKDTWNQLDSKYGIGGKLKANAGNLLALGGKGISMIPHPYAQVAGKVIQGVGTAAQVMTKAIGDKDSEFARQVNDFNKVMNSKESEEAKKKPGFERFLNTANSIDYHNSSPTDSIDATSLLGAIASASAAQAAPVPVGPYSNNLGGTGFRKLRRLRVRGYDNSKFRRKPKRKFGVKTRKKHTR